MPSDRLENEIQQYVEVFDTTIHRRDGKIKQVDVEIEYGNEDGSIQNTVRFDCTGGVAKLDGFETPISDVEDLRVIPAAETVVKAIDGLEDVVPSFHVFEDQFNDGYQAVDNRLEMDNVPLDLVEGVEADRHE